MENEKFINFSFKAYMAMEFCTAFKSGAALALEEAIIGIIGQELKLDRSKLVTESLYQPQSTNRNMIVFVRRKGERFYFANIEIKDVPRHCADTSWRTRLRDKIRGGFDCDIKRTEPKTSDIENGAIDFVTHYKKRFK